MSSDNILNKHCSSASDTLPDQFPEKFIITEISDIFLFKSLPDEPPVVAFTGQFTSNELVFHISGKQEVFVNGKHLNIGKNHIRFHPQGDNRQYIVKREDYGACIDIKFTCNIPLSKESFAMDMSDNSLFRDLIQKCYTLWLKKDKDYYLRCMSILYQLLAIILHNAYFPKERFSVLSPAEEYIVSNFDKSKISIPHLAELCGISESYFKTLFVSKHSLTPKKYITMMKIEQAKTLLLSGYYSVKSVSEMTGFENTYYFSKVFKQETGLPPSEYVKKYTVMHNQYSLKESNELYTLAVGQKTVVPSSDKK